MDILTEIFTWWNGQTLGTRFFTARNGSLVGEDDAGNKFYETKDGKRRWVIYAGEAEASNVSPDWHGWLHHTLAEAPEGGSLPRHVWEKDHVPNMTGTDQAYRPPGSVLTPASRPKVVGDYQAWQPE
ncbi:MAG: NADH:ubiquinone oxidoreductase subunit NDUFA12 [Pseudomonadota bacterium]